MDAFAPNPTDSPASPVRRTLKNRSLAWAQGLLLSSLIGWGGGVQAQDTEAARPDTAVVADSGIGAELFYRLLIGEIQIEQGQTASGFNIMLDAGRKYGRPEIFRRAIEIALQAQAGESALAGARAWAEAQPKTAEAQRQLLQLLLALQRPTEIAPPLRALLGLTPGEQRPETLWWLQSHLARLKDPATALKNATPVLQEATGPGNPHQAVFAWSLWGQFQLASGDSKAALQSARKAWALNRQSPLPAWLVWWVAETQANEALPLLQTWLDTAKGTDTGSLRLRQEYARQRMEKQDWGAAAQQLAWLQQQSTVLPETWLLQGLWSLQQEQHAVAEQAFKRYLEQLPPEATPRQRTQAQLLLSQLAEARQDWAEAQHWLDSVDMSEPTPSAFVIKRAFLLGKQGQVAAARALLHSLPTDNPAAVRLQALTEAELLRDLGEYRQALEVYQSLHGLFPQDTDLLYQYAMTAEKAGDFAQMESLLRTLMALEPQHAHAHNALGYSFAERGIRLDEAQGLLERALELQPNDPFIQDSMGWLVFQKGDATQALVWLQRAYQNAPDVEIAAHLGEVLWRSGQTENALAVWRQGLQKQANNPTLRQTLERLQVQP